MTQTTGNINEVELKLSPYANYTFKISAVNQLGESVQSNVTNHCQTRAALPAYNPTGVKILEDQTGKLVIEWDVRYLYELYDFSRCWCLLNFCTTYIEECKKKS